MRYKGVIFDLDNTLYDYDSLNEKAIAHLCKFGAELAGVSEEKFTEAFDWGRLETKRILGENPSARNRLFYMQHALERIGKFSCEHALVLESMYWDYMLQHMSLFEHAYEVIKRIKEQGGMIGICTDLTAQIQFRKIKQLGIAPYIDIIVSSEEVGVEKPHKEMFEFCLKKMSLLPEDTIMIGDSYKKDILGAKEAGIATLLFGSQNENTQSAGNYEDVERYIFGKAEE